MKVLKITLSWVSIITVTAVVLFASICPHISSAKAVNVHSSCADKSIGHTEISNKNGSCLGLAMNTSGYLLGILPNISIIISLIFVALFILTAQKLREILINNTQPLFSKFRHISFWHKTYIWPTFKEKFNIWQNLVVHPIVVIAA